MPADQGWRTITPLTRSPVPSAHENLFFVGDAARVVEPFTGEGIYYALQSGELSAKAIAKNLRGDDGNTGVREYGSAYAQMECGGFWSYLLAHAAGHSTQTAGPCCSMQGVRAG